jgi:hypothetical protein
MKLTNGERRILFARQVASDVLESKSGDCPSHVDFP